MDWTRQVDIYCERTDFTYWSEPLNALTNFLYLFGALYMFSRVRRDELPLAVALSVLLGCIAVGSFLFHTHATTWASIVDVTPIGLFILTYLFAVHRDVLGLPRLVSLGGAACFIPFAAVVVPLIDTLTFFRISNFYWTVPILLIAYAPIVARKRQATALGMLAGAGLLSISISVRSVDLMVCDAFPIGTHIFWHTLNAVMLPMMIEVYRRHMLAGRGA